MTTVFQITEIKMRSFFQSKQKTDYFLVLHTFSSNLSMNRIEINTILNDAGYYLVYYFVSILKNYDIRIYLSIKRHIRNII